MKLYLFIGLLAIFTFEFILDFMFEFIFVFMLLPMFEFIAGADVAIGIGDAMFELLVI